MRRHISGLLALSLALSLCACGGTADRSAAGTPAAESAPAVISLPPVAEETAAPAPAPTPAVSETAEAASTDTPAPSAAPAAAPVETPASTSEPTAAPEETPAGIPMPEFTTVDLEGKQVTNDIFAQADLTVVNVWGTYCPPCIAEMPDLGRWAAEMPDNLQLIGIVCDLYGDDRDTHDLAVTIMEQAGASFPCLAACDGLIPLLYSIPAVPATFFVDRQGSIVGKAILGAQLDRYKAAVEELLP